jgi:hypothetical protein
MARRGRPTAELVFSDEERQIQVASQITTASRAAFNASMSNRCAYAGIAGLSGLRGEA